MLQYIEYPYISGKDMIKVGKTDDFEWIVVADGNGNGHLIHILRNLQWNLIIRNFQPMDLIKNILLEQNHNDNDFISISIVKIYKSGFLFFWIGNSQIRLYKNNSNFWRSSNHDGENNDESIKMAQKNVAFKSVYKISVINHDKITSKNTRLFTFNNILQTPLTRSFGSNNIMNSNYQTHFIPFDSKLTNTWRIIVATDGFWDVVSEDKTIFFSNKKSTAVNLADYAKNNWIKCWKYYDKENNFLYYSYISNSRDDISVAIWDPENR